MRTSITESKDPSDIGNYLVTISAKVKAVGKGMMVRTWFKDKPDEFTIERLRYEFNEKATHYIKALANKPKPTIKTKRSRLK